MTDLNFEIGKLADIFSSTSGADIILVNSPIVGPFDETLIRMLEKRQGKKRKVFVIVVSEGGLGDVAFRACRALQMNYDEIAAVVAGWCKSAGTLFCVGAHSLVMGRKGELGPIDVQLRRVDEIGERDSGLAIDAAFDGLSEASFKLFEKYMMGIKEKSFGSVTFRTAADIAAQVAIGLVQPIFAQLDPIKVGEIHRSVRVADQYARRLALIGQNLRRDSGFDAVDLLVRGYPSHSFCVDFLEAGMLFKNVSEPEQELADLIEVLGDYAISPLVSDVSGYGGPTSRVEYLNNDDTSSEGVGTPSAESGAASAGEEGRVLAEGVDSRREGLSSIAA